jgi:thioredoxin reductase (NADPH)
MSEQPGSIEVDVLIVGAGPTGLYAAYYAGFRGLSAAIVDSLPEPGGQITALYPEKLIFDVAGFPAIVGRDLVAGLVEQADQYTPTYLLGRQARELLDRPGGGLRMTLEDGTVVDVGAVLITAGIGEFSPRPLPVGEDWLDHGLCYFVPKLNVHAGQDVVVVGGGDSAFDWAMALHPIANSVTLVHRRAKFRAHAGTVDKVRDLGVEIITDAQVTALRGEDGTLAECEIELTGAGSRVLPAHSVVAALGFTADLGPIESWGLELSKRAIVVDSTMLTRRDRVFAAGDIVEYPGKVKLIATGFGEAATAINNIAVTLDPSAHLFPGHSTG